MITLGQLTAAWNAFFFDPVPVHSVALFRILFSIVLLIDAIFLLANAREYLGPEGLIEHARYYDRNRGRALSLFLHLPGTMRSVYLILGLHIFAIVLLGVGLFTPVSTAIAFVTLRSIVNRNPKICNGGDNVARIMCFLLIFTPAGRAYSVDSILFHAPGASDQAALFHAPWALRLMQIQISIIYLRACYWKLRGVTYRNGIAIYYATISEYYRRLSVPRFFVRTPIVQALTWGTLALEGALGSAIWVQEFRAPLIVMGIFFHAAIEFVLNLHLFGWYMIVCLLLFVDPYQVMRLF
jgi:Vitamin K-dependent gamma-carboxylase